ncbi:MAG TPA: molybdate ABC transporter substrate-binding protein [Patescibacteria group bacterium]|nr:molybdate ABC transporter substrate-binding protein [Patescibacteria group bacterium]
MFARRAFATIAALGLLALSALPSRAAELPTVTVYAAASTTDALNEIGGMFAAAGKGKVVGSYAASSTLAKQIENGAPAQLFISADEKWADYLDDKKLLVPGSRVALLGNRMALIAPVDSKIKLDVAPNFALAAALNGGLLSVGDPDHVPVGIYTKAALEKLGVWSSVEFMLARTDSVRAALAFVERGECPLGIVYTTDAAIDPKVRVVSIFPEDSHPPIIYPAALVAGQETPAAREFFEYLQTPAVKDVFRKYGFLVK